MIKKDAEIEEFDSFLAGLLLTKTEIDCLEFSRLQVDFENYYNVYLFDNQDVCLPVILKDDKLTLEKLYDDYILVNNKEVKVQDYLYSLTSERVREYFKLNNLSIKKVLV